MPIYLRDNGIWYIDITTPSGGRIRRSAGTADKTAAQELHDKLKHESWRVDKLGDKPSKTWDEACVRFIKEKAHKKSLADDKAKIRALTSFRGRLLTDLSRDFIMRAIDGLDVTNSTKNRYGALIRTILNLCAGEWEWIDKAPTISFKKEPRKRIRWITTDEASRLIAALPQFYADMAEFSLMTGLRQYNVLTLEWSQVDMQRKTAWIHPDQTKSGRPLGVPLNDRAVAVLQRQMFRHKKYVFVSDVTKRPLESINSRTWNKALETAEISDFRWHDMRHTWASWLVQSGVPLMDLKEMGGWETLEMVQRYAHLAPQHLHKNAMLLDFDVTNSAQLKN